MSRNIFAGLTGLFSKVGLSRSQWETLSGSTLLAIAGVLLRIGYVNKSVILVSSGILCLEIGGCCLIHAAGKRFHQHRADKRGFVVHKQSLAESEGRLGRLQKHAINNANTLARDLAELEWRKTLDFAEEKLTWIAEMAAAGYRSGLNFNKSRMRPKF